MFPTNSGGDHHVNLAMDCHNLKIFYFLYVHSSCKFGGFIDAVRVSNLQCVCENYFSLRNTNLKFQSPFHSAQIQPNSCNQLNVGINHLF